MSYSLNEFSVLSVSAFSDAVHRVHEASRCGSRSKWIASDLPECPLNYPENNLSSRFVTIFICWLCFRFSREKESREALHCEGFQLGFQLGFQSSRFHRLSFEVEFFIVEEHPAWATCDTSCVSDTRAHRPKLVSIPGPNA